MIVRNSENALRKIWQSGKCSVNGWIGIPSGIVAEVMAQAGWDSLTVDVQHGMQDATSLVNCLQGIETTDTVPLVRVPWLEPGILMKALDAGSRGIICPDGQYAHASRSVGAILPLSTPGRAQLWAHASNMADGGRLCRARKPRDPLAPDD